MPKTFPLEATLEQTAEDAQTHIVPTGQQGMPPRALCGDLIVRTPEGLLCSRSEGAVLCPACNRVLARDHQSSFRLPRWLTEGEGLAHARG